MISCKVKAHLINNKGKWIGENIHLKQIPFDFLVDGLIKYHQIDWCMSFMNIYHISGEGICLTREHFRAAKALVDEKVLGEEAPICLSCIQHSQKCHEILPYDCGLIIIDYMDKRIISLQTAFRIESKNSLLAQFKIVDLTGFDNLLFLKLSLLSVCKKQGIMCDFLCEEWNLFFKEIT